MATTVTGELGRSGPVGAGRISPSFHQAFKDTPFRLGSRQIWALGSEVLSTVVSTGRGFQNRLEVLREQMHIKLSSRVSDLLGVSGRRMLHAVAETPRTPSVAALADTKLCATPEQLHDEKDISAVSAAVDTVWSTGQVEGQINRLKMIKRQMYGRAGFDLLRARVLPYASVACAPRSP